jgi:ribosomal protein L11 methyltransferase
MFELCLLAPEGSVEAVSDSLLEDLGALSVSVEDADAQTDAERALFGEPGLPLPASAWERSRISALFADEASATAAATLLLARGGSIEARVLSIGELADQDWVRLTQSQFAPVCIEGGFWIVPTWHEPPAGANRVIRLDPGLAFGTGTHPTTRMCLRWIARHATAEQFQWSRVLDYGCGSGILAIGAALYGAGHIDAVDIDPAAIEAARANALANGVALAAALPDGAKGQYGLVLANILATPLTLLAPVLCRHLRSDASLLLAGILARQSEELKAAYAPWLQLEVADAEDGWILMHGRLPKGHSVA